MDFLIEASIYYQLVAILVLASVVGAVAVKLRQPLIVAFIITGLLAGPHAFNVVGHYDRDVIETFSQIGIVLLLFIVGLKLDLRIIRESGPVALIAGVAQVALTFALGAGLAMFIGFQTMPSVFIGLALSFSSTIVAVKLLSDRRAVDSLYGRIAIGILIIQDLLVIVVMIALTAFVSPSEGQAFNAGTLGLIAAKLTVLVLFTAFFIRYLAKPLTHMLARNAELMAIFCLTFGVLMAGLCEHFGFSKELGGLIAGVALASTPYNNIIAARLYVLRDFMLLFFFAHLGMQMQLDGIGHQIIPALVLSGFVLIGKPLIIMTIMSLMHFRKRTGFLSGLALSQISEFSLILIAMAYNSELLGTEALNMMTLVGLITMWLSTYAIVYSDRIYDFLESKTGVFIRRHPRYREEQEHHQMENSYDVVIFGLGRYGEAMARAFRARGYNVLGVDFNPDTIARVQQDGFAAVYGDAADPEFPTHLTLDRTKVVILAFHHYLTGPLITDLRRTLARSLRDSGYKGHIAATSHHPDHDFDLAHEGIDIILNPYEDAGLHGSEYVARIIENKA